ncbi:hypothetical protein I8752_26730 [Nostocaceae cyanobacterium CENA369]|jgi:hypothetical protein|uniref:Uncharacterized protein n=1 Tax=Dendronalium phyllosphericum CENA369 TaxID=1725256 RepID=A0A8J7LGP6_9NOST|nr:hypothetical protein [Dendronalium phyllosphericum]MBH8576521.1 hypothetical protein [Dendronalium phyllosphericum CENA369]
MTNLKNFQKLIALANEYGINCQATPEECLVASLPGYDDFLLAFTWSGAVEGEPLEHELIAISVQDLTKEVTVAAWQIPTYLFGNVLRQAQMLVAAHRDFMR